MKLVAPLEVVRQNSSTDLLRYQDDAHDDFLHFFVLKFKSARLQLSNDFVPVVAEYLQLVIMCSNSSLYILLYVPYMRKHLPHLHQYHHLSITAFNLLLHDLRCIRFHLQAHHHSQQRKSIPHRLSISNGLALAFLPAMLSPFGLNTFIHKYMCQQSMMIKFILVKGPTRIPHILVQFDMNDYLFTFEVQTFYCNEFVNC